MRNWRQAVPVAFAFALILVVLTLSHASPVVAQQSKELLAQIINTPRNPVPVVNVGGAEQTTIVFDGDVSELTEPFTIDVSAFGQIRVIVGHTGGANCEIQVSTKYGELDQYRVPLETLKVTGATGTSAVYDLPGYALMLRAFSCSTRVVIMGRS